MNLESFNQLSQKKTEEKKAIGSIEVPNQRPYKKGDFASVLRGNQDIESDWIVKNFDATQITCVKFINGEWKKKTTDITSFVDLQTRVGDRRGNARNLLDEQSQRMRSEIVIEEKIKELEVINIDSIQKAEEFLQSMESAYKFRAGDSYDYRALWNFVYNNLKTQIKFFKEKYGENSAPFNLAALKMRKMNEADRILWPIDKNQEFKNVERQEQNEKIEDVEKLITSERLRGKNVSSMWVKILEIYGIKESRNAKGLDEFNSVMRTRLPFKIENSNTGLVLIWPGAGYDFKFFGELKEQDTHKLAEKIDKLIKEASK